MKIKYFTNSMVLISGKKVSILCDPWITFDRNSSSNLYNFPETNFTKDEIASINMDYIYITHTHPDHFDKTTLNLFNKKTPVLCSDYKNNFTEKNLKSLGFNNVIVCKDDQSYYFNDQDSCNLYVAKINSEVDSLGIFNIDGVTMLNANDIVYDKRQMDYIGKKFKIDMAMLPFAYKGPYPAFYENLKPKEKEKKANDKKFNNYELMFKFIDSTKPKKVFPFAAGGIYGGNKAKLYAYFGEGTAYEAIKYCKDRGQKFDEILINSNELYDFSSGKTSSEFKQISFQDQSEYLDAISKKKTIFDEEFISERLDAIYPHSNISSELFMIGKSYELNLKRILKKARSNQMKWQNEMNIVSKKVFFIDVGHNYLYRLSLADNSVDTVMESEIKDENYEIFRCSYSLFIGMVTGHFNYSNVKTSYMSFYRKPNQFDPDLHKLMSYLQL